MTAPAHDPIGDVEGHVGELLPDDHDPWGEAGDLPAQEEELDDDDTVPGSQS